MRADTTFQVQNNLQISGSGKLGFNLNTDKETYSPGDTVHITATANKIVAITKLDLIIAPEQEVNINCGVFDCGVTANKIDLIRYLNNGIASYDYTLPASAKLGKYTVKLDAGFGVFTTTFDVEKKTAAQPSVGSVYEKFNRITDAVTDITLTDKQVEDQHVAPQAVHGSLVIARGSEKEVNITITSESGICIIGQQEGCLVSNDTTTAASDYKEFEIEGVKYMIMYSGPDVFLEKFDIKTSNGTPIPNSTWVAQISKNDLPSKFYYEITYIPIQ